MVKKRGRPRNEGKTQRCLPWQEMNHDACRERMQQKFKGKKEFFLVPGKPFCREAATALEEGEAERTSACRCKWRGERKGKSRLYILLNRREKKRHLPSQPRGKVRPQSARRRKSSRQGKKKKEDKGERNSIFSRERGHRFSVPSF